MLGAIAVYHGTAEGGAYDDMTEYAPKRFQQVLAESFARPDCQFRIVGTLGIPCAAETSEYRKSRMKKCSDNRSRPKSSNAASSLLFGLGIEDCR